MRAGSLPGGKAPWPCLPHTRAPGKVPGLVSSVNPPMKNLSLRQLQVFDAFADTLSDSAAAEVLGITQPAVSMLMRQLESDGGTALTVRQGRHMDLTAAGTTLQRHARSILEQVRLAEESLASLKSGTYGHLHLGVVSTANYFAPQLLMEFQRRTPGVTFKRSVARRDRDPGHAEEPPPGRGHCRPAARRGRCRGRGLCTPSALHRGRTAAPHGRAASHPLARTARRALHLPRDGFGDAAVPGAPAAGTGLEGTGEHRTLGQRNHQAGRDGRLWASASCRPMPCRWNWPPAAWWCWTWWTCPSGWTDACCTGATASWRG